VSRLIIIGNGFDLHCGLKSTYDDFFKFLLKDSQYNREFNYLFDNGKYLQGNKRVNIIWALLLSYHDEEKSFLWKDIESIIAALLYKPDMEYSINLNDILKNIRTYTDQLRDTIKQDIYYNTPTLKFLWILHRGNNMRDICSFTHTNILNKFNIILNDTKDILNKINEDLHQIELKFIEYLKSIYNLDNTTHVIANETYSQLLGIKHENDTQYEDRVSKLHAVLQNVNILSFNYTRLGQTNGYNFRHFQNIHGTFLGKYDEIIFGIDSFDMTPKNPVYKFTKTYRLSILDNILSNDPDIFTGQINYDDIEEIIIYGHSLNYQDYSYFYAIFNKCNIALSNTSIVLYYSNFGNIDRASENIDRLHDLIYEYEIGFNKPRGLYHRMSIDGRIKIKELK